MLNLASVHASRWLAGQEYDLVSVTAHVPDIVRGKRSMDRGHYISYVRPEKRSLFTLNDSNACQGPYQVAHWDSKVTVVDSLGFVTCIYYAS